MYIPYPIESGYIGNMNTFGIMFICTGNICRSPLAHAVFEQMVKKNDLGQKIEVESSGTNSYHRGEQPDDRMRRTAERHGLIINHRSRRLSRLDVENYNLLLTMDEQNFADTLALCRTDENREKVMMFRNFDPEGRGEVPDPWYGRMDGFELVWRIVYRTCESLLDYVHGVLRA